METVTSGARFSRPFCTMSDWTASEVVELLRLQGAPKHSLEFSFKHGIDGAIMDESVDFVVRDLRLASIADEERIVKKWREISLLGAKPQEVLSYKKEIAGSWQPKAVRALSQKFPVPEPVPATESTPVRNEEVNRKPSIIQNQSRSVGSVGNEETYSQDFDDATESHSAAPPEARPTGSTSVAKTRSRSEESSIPDEAPLVQQNSQFEGSVQTNMQPPSEQVDMDATIVKQTQEYLARKTAAEPREIILKQSLAEIEEAKEAARAEAAARYEAALQKQTELLRIQQERIRLQTLLIERQREELHTLNTPREVEVVKPAAHSQQAQALQQTQVVQQAQQVPAGRHAHWGGAEEAGDEEDEQYFYTSSAPLPRVEMQFSPPIHAVGVWGQASSGLQDSISMLSGSEVFENASSDGNNNHHFEKGTLPYNEEIPQQPPYQASPAPPTPRNTVNLSIEATSTQRPASSASNRARIADAGHTPAAGRAFPHKQRVTYSAGNKRRDDPAPSAAPVSSAAVKDAQQQYRARQESQTQNDHELGRASSPDHAGLFQPSIDSVGMTWYRKPDTNRPKTGPKYTSKKPDLAPVVPLLKLPVATAPAGEVYKEAKATHRQNSPVRGGDTLRQARPSSVPSTRRHPSPLSIDHASLLTPFDTKLPSPSRVLEEGPVAAAVHRLFDSARDEAIAQVQEWARQQQAQHRELLQTKAEKLLDDARPFQPFGRNGEHWPEQLRLYDTPQQDTHSPGLLSSRRPLTGTGNGRRKPPSSSKLQKLLNKLAVEHGMYSDPRTVEQMEFYTPQITSRSAPQSSPGRQTTRDIHREQHALPEMKPETSPLETARSGKRKGGTLCLLDAGSGTVRDGYAAPLRRPDEPPLYSTTVPYRPRKPSVDARPSSRGATSKPSVRTTHVAVASPKEPAVVT